MTEPKYLIWSNYSLDYEDWREDLEAEYPELSEQEREEKMYDRNGDGENRNGGQRFGDAHPEREVQQPHV